MPSAADGREDDLKLALEAAERLSQKWDERGFPSRTPYHVRPLFFLSVRTHSCLAEVRRR